MPPLESLHALVAARMDPRPLGVVRAAVGLVLLVAALDHAVFLGAWMASPALARVPWTLPAPVLPVVAYPPFALLWITAAVAFTLGYRTRLAGGVLLACMAYSTWLDQQLYSNHLYLAFVLCLLLTVAESGAAFSLRPLPAREVAAWPATLLRAQVSIVYAFTAAAKVNVLFLSGTVLLRYVGDGSLLPVPEALRTPELFAPLAAMVVLTEFFLAGALWWPRLRPLAFVVGLGLHGGILLVMPFSPLNTAGLLVIGLGVLAPYLLFLDAAPASRVVVWDDTCSFCRVWVRAFRGLDWLGVHRFVGSSDPAALRELGITREAADRAMWWIGPEGRAEGFDAVRRVLEALPASFLWAPALALPPVRRIGHRAYRRVAGRRRCELPSAPPAKPCPPLAERLP